MADDLNTNRLLSFLSPDVVNQVRQDYSKQKLEELLKLHVHATELTPEIEILLERMIKETNVNMVLDSCQAEQNKRERELWQRREDIKEEHEKMMASIEAKEAMGVKLPNEKRQVQQATKDALLRMDRFVLREMDMQVRIQQEALMAIHVPGFHVTKDQAIIEFQENIIRKLLPSAP
ncbi:hypothetical protein DM01DRAFT_1404505 [Hesseltinella vesiculosa]|uniref:Uncharacterized protein n=1 Tax=Hesseltinella vesiculosa TaxID=101127 RepID=A0A1X2GUV3_9FUNG|nr:hypothetical protein DM01DRAFT_1404505 [Hesseltinella vesiculosa]